MTPRSSAASRLLPLLATALTLVLGSPWTGCASGSGQKSGAKLSPATAESIAAFGTNDLRLARVVVDGRNLEPASFPVTLRFDRPGSLGGKGPVNRYFGGYTLGGKGAVTWPPAGFRTTRMAGPEPAMRREAVFLEGMKSTTTLKTSVDTAQFSNAAGTTLFEFKR